MELIPFGSNCIPAEILRAGGVRRHSLPFDWLFAYPENIRKSLDLDFSDWFDASLMKVLNSDPQAPGRIWTTHENYDVSHVHELAGFFNHHDMTDLKTQESFKKRIQRFKDIVSSNRHVLFVTSSTPQELEDAGLTRYFDRPSKTTFIYLEHIPSADYFVSYSITGGDVKITYHAPNAFDNTVGILVSDCIKEIYKTL